MVDFSLDIYRELLETFIEKEYEILTFSDYCRKKGTAEYQDPEKKYVILRHDVDAKPWNSVTTAEIEHSLGIRATYYFRVGKESNVPEVIRLIAQMGHEIGYHYEDMSLCGGDIDKAWDHFQTWLEYFRQYYAVETICMHGAPTSKYDSKDLWTKYDYKTLGVIGEPYMDTDFSQVVYLTDTGRCWDGFKVSRRDKIPHYQDEWEKKHWAWHTTPEFLADVKVDWVPKRMMITTHPQRWSNDRKEWWKEFIGQNIKNWIKEKIVKG